MSKESEMRAALLKTMRVRNSGDWFPDLIVCRWCGHWLEEIETYHSGPVSKIAESHDPDCLAVRLLGRPVGRP